VIEDTLSSKPGEIEAT